PAHLLCPISLDWLVNPVITPSGITYSREELDLWVRENGTDPVARSRLAMSEVISNLAIMFATAVH
ncbi:hypothetical protein JKP88DRAFT_142454, partial [Tribonema minus]